MQEEEEEEPVTAYNNISARGCLRQRRIIALLGTLWKSQGTEIPTVDGYTFTKGTMSFLRGKLEQESWSFFFNDPRMEAKTRSKEFFRRKFSVYFSGTARVRNLTVWAQVWAEKWLVVVAAKSRRTELPIATQVPVQLGEHHTLVSIMGAEMRGK